MLEYIAPHSLIFPAIKNTGGYRQTKGAYRDWLCYIEFSENRTIQHRQEDGFGFSDLLEHTFATITPAEQKFLL